MKALGDWAFSAGINRIVFHRYQNQAGLGLSPGMTMGPYGVHWERTQTWWDMVPAYHALSRPLSVPAEAGGARGRRLFPRRRGRAPRLPASGFGAPERPARSRRRGLRRLSAGDPARLGGSRGREGRVPGRRELPRAGPPRAGDDDAEAPAKGPRSRRGRRHGRRAAAAQIALAFRLSGLRRRSRAPGLRGLGRLRRGKGH